MTTYNSYQEAKIANPDSEIVTTGPKWKYNPDLKWKFEKLVEDDDEGEAHALEDSAWVKCRPSGYCMTVEEFLAKGHKFVDGDVILNFHFNTELRVEVIYNEYLGDYNDPDKGDSSRYILRAAALENKMNTDRLETQSEEQPKRVKVEYLKVDFVSDKEKAEAFIEGGLRYLTHGEIRGDLESDTIPVTRLDELLCGNSIYRRIETEITERDEFIQGYLELADSSVGVSYKEFAGIVFDKLVEGE